LTPDKPPVSGQEAITIWKFFKVFVPTFFGVLTTLFAAFGVIGAWAYRVGSTRLGVVDLFGCEISTLCRVALVTDTVGRLRDRIEQTEKAGDGSVLHAAEPRSETSSSVDQASDDRTPPQRVAQFTSAENYFPVFESNARDLQSLEARVVINITSFYTFMKAVRDFLRSAAALKPKSASTNDDKVGQLQANTWHNAMRDVIYMMFLGLEAGRSSVEDLVEYEPEQAERTVVILISELRAYLFLLREFDKTDDIRERRLVLRWPAYRKDFQLLKLRVDHGEDSAWINLTKAKTSSRPEKTEIALRELELTTWQGAREIWRDLDLLYGEVEDFISKRARDGSMSRSTARQLS
jgi:hypothetical protein